jgi:hypothetical protein
MELTDEQLEIIKQASAEIDFGRITIDFTGSPSFVVDITAEKQQRFQRYRKADESTVLKIRPAPRNSGQCQKVQL